MKEMQMQINPHMPESLSSHFNPSVKCCLMYMLPYVNNGRNAMCPRKLLQGGCRFCYSLRWNIT